MASESDLVFTLNSDGTGYTVDAASTDISGALTIPATHEGLPVSIADADSAAAGAFYRCRNLTALSFEEGFARIGNYAFSSCTGLVSVSLPTTLEVLGAHAFFLATSLSSVEIPDGCSMYENGGSQFEDCVALGTVIVGNGIPDVRAFSGCGVLTKVTLGADVKTLGGLGRCYGLEEINLPDGLNAFADEMIFCVSGLRSITFPASMSQKWYGVSTSSRSAAFYGSTELFVLNINGGGYKLDEPQSVSTDAVAFAGTPVLHGQVNIIGDTTGWTEGETWCGMTVAFSSLDDVSISVPESYRQLSFSGSGGNSIVPVLCAAGAGSVSYSAIDDATGRTATWITFGDYDDGGDRESNNIVVAANTAEARSAVVTFSGSGGGSATVLINQASSAVLTPSPSALTFGAAGGSLVVSLSVDGSAGDLAASSSESWISASISGTTLTVSASGNTTGSARSGTVTISAEGAIPAVVSVSQTASEITVSPTSLSFEATGGTQTATLTVGDDAGDLTASCSASWFSASISGTTLSVVAAENATDSSRTGTVTVAGTGGSLATLAVSQAVADTTITVSPTSLVFAYPADSATVSFSVSGGAAGSISAAASEAWITPSLREVSATARVAFSETATSGTTMNGTADDAATLYGWFGTIETLIPSASRPNSTNVLITPEQISLFRNASSATNASVTVYARILRQSADGSAWAVAYQSPAAIAMSSVTDDGGEVGPWTLENVDGRGAIPVGENVILCFAPASDSAATTVTREAAKTTSAESGALTSALPSSGSPSSVQSYSWAVKLAWSAAGAVISGGGAEVATSDGAAADLVSGGYASADYAFYAGSNYLVLTDADIDWRGSWTVSVAVKADASATYAAWNTLLAIGDSSNHLRVQINSASATSGVGLYGRHITDGNEVALLYADNSFGVALSVGAWTLITLTYEYSTSDRGAWVKLYTDGVLIAENTQAWLFDADSSSQISVGGPASGTTGTRWIGYYGGISVYSAALLAVEIANALVGKSAPAALAAALTVAVSENTATVTRTGTVTLYGANGGSATVSVAQNGTTEQLSVSPTELTFPQAGGSAGVVVISNVTGGWTFAVTGNATFSAAKSSDTAILVTAAARTDGDDTTYAGWLTITAGELTATVALSQEGEPWTGSIPGGNGSGGSSPTPEIVTGDNCILRGREERFIEKSTITGGVNADGSEDWTVTLAMRRELVKSFCNSANLYVGSFWQPVALPSRNAPPIAGWTVDETSPGSGKVKIKYAIRSGWSYSSTVSNSSRAEAITSAEVERPLAENGSLFPSSMSLVDRAKIVAALRQYYVYIVGGDDDQLGKLDEIVADLLQDSTATIKTLVADYPNVWACIQSGQTSWVDYVTVVTVTTTSSTRPTTTVPGSFDEKPSLNYLHLPTGIRAKAWLLRRDDSSVDANKVYTRVREWHSVELESPTYGG